MDCGSSNEHFSRGDKRKKKINSVKHRCHQLS
jgi:hypothetical protein